MMNKKPKLRIIFSTFPNKQAAIDIAHDLITEKLIACANIQQLGASVFEWEDKVQVQDETSAFFKTNLKKLKAAIKFIRKDHPYESPCIIVYKPDQVNKSYLAWMEKQLKQLPPK